ncbi:MAG: mechanosensitive ion channel family protein [Thiobacillaceae bacterium]
MESLIATLGLTEAAKVNAFTQSAIHIVLILIGAWALKLLANKGIRSFRIYMESRKDSLEDRQRLETLGRVFRYAANVAVTAVAGMLVFTELGISIAPILATAGVLGLAVGFGAQSLVKDYFSGLFLLLENQIRHGDVVEAGGKSGLVEEVTLRYVRLRGYDGNVHFVPNGQINTVTNMTRGFSYAVIDIGVAYREEIDEVFSVIREVAAEIRRDEQFKDIVLDDVDLAGVDNWADSSVTIRLRIKVVPIQQWTVRREFLRRLKYAFDARGIEIPFPHLTIYAGQLKDGSAPRFRAIMQDGG